LDEREIIALYAALVFFDLGQRREIIDYQYDHHLNTVKTEPSSALLQRDQAMEERIRDLWGKTPGDLLHVGGIFHTQAPYHNLYERLRDLHPVRRKLNEF